MQSNPIKNIQKLKNAKTNQFDSENKGSVTWLAESVEIDKKTSKNTVSQALDNSKTLNQQPKPNSVVFPSKIRQSVER